MFSKLTERLTRAGTIAPNVILGLYTERQPAASYFQTVHRRQRRNDFLVGHRRTNNAHVLLGSDL